MGQWLDENGIPIEAEDIDPKAFGFVYLIQNLVDDRIYIGKKRLRFTRTKKLKGKKVKVVTKSDWETYYGSSKELQADVQKLGEEKFKRTILLFCYSSGECSYWELHHQMSRSVLLFPDMYYNSYVGARIHRKHILKKGISC